MELLTHPSRGQVLNPVAAQSIAAGATVNSPAVRVNAARKVRAWYKTKGANTTAKLQGSFDNTAWYDLQTLAAGANAGVDVLEPFMRVTLTNAGTAAETNDIHLFVQL